MIAILATLVLSHAPIPTYSLVTADEMVEVMTARARTEYRKKLPPLREIAEAAIRAGKTYDVDPLLLVAIAWYESRWKPLAKGDCWGRVCRAHGLMQLHEGTIVGSLGIPLAEIDEVLVTIEGNLHYGAALLKNIERKYGKRRTLLIYSCGPRGIKTNPRCKGKSNTAVGRLKLRLQRKLRKGVTALRVR